MTEVVDGRSVVLANNAAVVFNQNADGTLLAAVCGSGSFIKTGTAVLTLGAATSTRARPPSTPARCGWRRRATDAGLIVDYTMNGSAGSAIADGTLITDRSGYGNNGTMQGSGTFLAAPHGSGFTVSSQFIAGPHLNLNTWSTSEWVQWDSSLYSQGYGNHTLVSGRQGSTSQGAFDSYYTDGSGNPNGIWTESRGDDAGGAPLGLRRHGPACHSLRVRQLAHDYRNGHRRAIRGLRGWHAPGRGGLRCQLYARVLPDPTAYLTVAGDGYARMAGLAGFQLYSTVLSASQVQQLYQNQTLGFGSGLPANMPVQLASGPTFDLNGSAQTIDSLASCAGGGGTVTTAPPAGDPHPGAERYGDLQRPHPGRQGQVSLAINCPGAGHRRQQHLHRRHLRQRRRPGRAGTLASTVTVAALASIAPGDNTSGNFGGIGTLTVGGLTLSNGAMVDFDLGPTSDLLAVTGALTLNGATLNVQEAGGLTSGTYEIMSYGSLPGGFNAGSLLVSSLPAGFSALVVNNPGANQIDLDIYAMKLWTGSHGSAWNTSTANWAIAGGTATFGNSDAVAFDNTASTGGVSVTGTVAPTNMTVNNASLPYTFSGSGTSPAAQRSPSRAPARWPSTWRTTPTAAAPAWPAACSKSAPIARSPAGRWWPGRSAPDR